MNKQLVIQGKSQYEASIPQSMRASACGPTTVSVLLQQLLKTDVNIPLLYKLLGCSKIGLFSFRFIKNLQKLLGPNYHVEKCSVIEALQELDAERIVAVKFDRYFSIYFWKKSFYSYHWVPMIGYSFENEQLYLHVHDNGTPTRQSKLRKIHYEANKHAITFIKVYPLK